MKAAVSEVYGGPEVIRITDVPAPIPNTDEVLIKVHATTVNRTDCANLTAKPFIMRFTNGFLKPRKSIQGTDFSGVVTAVGSKVDRFQVGDKVFGMNDAWVSSHAQYMTVPANAAMASIPANFSFEEAAASIEGAHYAYNMINKVDLQYGQHVFVNGATGAIGSAAVQLLKHFGAVITATSNTKNLELIASIGADKVIDYTRQDFTKGADKYHHIFDTVGKSSFGKCRPILHPGGVYISSELGWMAENVFFSLFTPLFGGKKVRFPLPLNTQRSVDLVKELAEQGVFKPIIDKRYPLDEIADAYRYVLTGEKTGNVVILVAG